jgi:hypothetical protein
MYLDERRQRIFTNRTRHIYNAHKRRARLAGQALPYALADFRQFVSFRLDDGCYYCHVPLTVRLFSLDHEQPTSQGGSFEITNQRVCCAPCNKYKADLTGDQYRELLALLHTWPAVVQRRFLARLTAGFRFYPR